MPDHRAAGLNRRAFIRNSAAATVAYYMGAELPAQAFQAPANMPTQTPGADRPVTVGIIGPGSQGQADLSQMVKVPGVRILGVCDIYPPNLAKGMKIAGKDAAAHGDYRALLDDRRIEAVMVCTPLSLHAQMVIDALNAGKHVFVEKTMAYTVDECKEIVRTQQRTKKHVQVGHQRRYSVNYHHAKEFLVKNYAGKVLTIRAQWNEWRPWRRTLPPEYREKFERIHNWRLYREHSKGLMAELASHQMDVVNWFLGARPLSVVGQGGTDFWKDGREVEDNVHLVYEYPGGVHVTYQSITWNGYDGFSEQFFGDLGTLVVSTDRGLLFREPRAQELDFEKFATKEMSGKRSAIVLDAEKTTKQDKRGRGEGLALASGGQNKNEYYLEFVDFIDCVRTGKKPFCGAQVGLEAAATILRGKEAIEQGSRIVFRDHDFTV